jgi:hypothetical protein
MSSSGFDYAFVTKMSNFGRDLAGQFIGEPFNQYRITGVSSGDVVASANQMLDKTVTPNVPMVLHIKVGPIRSHTQIENETIHADTFDFLVSSDRVKTEDILSQITNAYDNNTNYCIASLRPLKKCIAIRVETYAKIYRPQSNRGVATPAGSVNAYSRFAGYTFDSSLPFVLTTGVFAPGLPTVTASSVPIGLQYIGQIKDQKAVHLPMDTLTTWWYIYVPLFPGMERLREGDMFEVQTSPLETPMRYRAHAVFVNSVGTRGVYCLCEKENL